MCTMITHQVKIYGRGKSGQEWIEVNEAKGPAARVAVELSVEAARELVKTIQAVLAEADQQGVLEDKHQAAAAG